MNYEEALENFLKQYLGRNIKNLDSDAVEKAFCLLPDKAPETEMT